MVIHRREILRIKNKTLFSFQTAVYLTTRIDVKERHYTKKQTENKDFWKHEEEKISGHFKILW